jgi:hypothetical protein
MPSRQPLLSGKTTSTFVEKEEFNAILTFGSSVLSTVQAIDMTVARANAGSYTVTLPRVYRTLVEVRWMAIDPAGGILLPVVDTNSVATDGTLLFELRTEAGTATDPDDTTKGMLCVVVSNHPFNDKTV